MITEQQYYIVPALIYQMYKGYNEGNLYANFIRLNDDTYAINERVAEDFSEEFSQVAAMAQGQGMSIEKRHLEYSEIWVDPELPPMI